MLKYIFSEIYKLVNIYFRVLKSFKPKAFVVQCGADGINGDPVGQCNLTLKGFGSCIKTILDCDLPTLFLGGGKCCLCTVLYV